ncbi:hypothetical protein K466DRAFT_568731 [Polyporus arcularius HHB13444]|uniref:Uncharacterized protein n=1 Tax=Polyporus arcularius HHB13444 TaxID=1314778 RepID=A0A5C3NWS9_9APHY|nr:hypothetical protein K466DRAFT_568731 [Polyporus arcularius HHB13444]
MDMSDTYAAPPGLEQAARAHCRDGVAAHAQREVRNLRPQRKHGRPGSERNTPILAISRQMAQLTSLDAQAIVYVQQRGEIEHGQPSASRGARTRAREHGNAERIQCGRASRRRRTSQTLKHEPGIMFDSGGGDERHDGWAETNGGHQIWGGVAQNDGGSSQKGDADANKMQSFDISPALGKRPFLKRLSASRVVLCLCRRTTANDGSDHTAGAENHTLFSGVLPWPPLRCVCQDIARTHSKTVPAWRSTEANWKLRAAVFVTYRLEAVKVGARWNSANPSLRALSAALADDRYSLPGRQMHGNHYASGGRSRTTADSDLLDAAALNGMRVMSQESARNLLTHQSSQRRGHAGILPWPSPAEARTRFPGARRRREGIIAGEGRCIQYRD